MDLRTGRKGAPAVLDESVSSPEQDGDAWPLKPPRHGGGSKVTVLLYEESDLVYRPQKPPTFRGHSLARLLQRSSGARDRSEAIWQALRALGFDWMVYGTVLRVRQNLQPRAFLSSYANRALLLRYFSRRHHEVDPFFQGTVGAELPIAWTLEELAAYAPLMSQRGREYLSDVQDCGVGSGVSFDVPGSSRANERQIFSLLSRDPRGRWVNDGVLEGALSLASCLHTRLSKDAHIRPQLAAPRQSLSARQLQILELLARGDSDRRIAEQLGLSAFTIDYHMRQLRSHFGVHNRVQLINAAGVASIWPARVPIP